MQSDSDGRDVWLLTTDAVGFYEYLGFTKLVSDLVGNDNPAWGGEPIPIHIVSHFDAFPAAYAMS